MYSHPDVWLGTGPSKRTPYRPQFDIYSMGLVLLEIGLWRTIDKMWFKCKDDTEFRLRVKTEYCDKLQSRMGLIYWRAVQRCLINDFDIGDKVLSGRTDFHLQVSFEKHVVSELERCCA
ncbi:hypothetical protein B0O99DRAFT_639478 [Bisporella sp. PMI_857]|nr:hypothetical protein B0O99DRAFT_639478 [Bisporella sp. PMI_857]